MKEYVNLEQLTLGCVSGKASEWQVLGVEARQALDEIASLRSELARLREAAELLAKYVACGETAWDADILLWEMFVQERDYPRLPREWEAIERSIRSNPTAAALVEQARKEKV